MYPTLYHFVHDVFGIDGGAVQWMKIVNSFGFFVAIAFIFAHKLLVSEMKRMEANGSMKAGQKKVTVGEAPKPLDILSNALLGFLLGYKFVYLFLNSQEAFGGQSRPQEMLLSPEGNWPAGIILGVLFAWLRWKEAKKQQLSEPKIETITVRPHEHAGNITLIAAVGGIAGSKLFHLLENPAQLVEFFTNPSVDNFLSGLTVYGGLIVGGGTVLLYAKYRCGLSMRRLMDATAPGLILAYGIGRIGCQVSGDGDWGIENTTAMPGWLNWLPDWLWAYDYPNNVNGVGQPILSGPCFDGYCTHLVPSVFPTPIYETLMCLLLFFVLWKLRTILQKPGALFAIYLVANGIERFFIEKIRVNVEMHFAGITFTQAELISVLFFLAGTVWLFLLYGKSAKSGIHAK